MVRNLFLPAFFVAEDQDQKALVVVFRVTMSLKDVLTDLVCQPEPRGTLSAVSMQSRTQSRTQSAPATRDTWELGVDDGLHCPVEAEGTDMEVNAFPPRQGAARDAYALAGGKGGEEEEEEEGLFKANTVNEEDPERDRAEE